MKKIFFTVLLIFICQSNIAAQADISYGLKGGVNFTKFDDLVLFGGFFPVETKIKSDFNLGYTIGLFTRFDLNKLMIQPEVLYNNSTSKYGSFGKFTISSLDIPILIGYEILQNSTIYTGGTLQFRLDEDFSNLNLSFDKNQSILFNLGFNYRINKFHIDFRYSIGVNDNVGSDLSQMASDGPGYFLNTNDSNIFTLAFHYSIN